jgi:aminotransferase
MSVQSVKRARPDIRAIARIVPPSGNLVQGQNETAIHPSLADALNEVVRAGLNSYSFFEGVDSLRHAVAEKIRVFNKIDIDPERRPLELIITPGGTGGLVLIAREFLTNASALVFEPYYPYHERILKEFGGAVDSLPLHGDDLTLDLDELWLTCKRASSREINPLKAIIVGSPANPSGRVFSRTELEAIVRCAEEFNLLIISDEVYEHFVTKPGGHISIASLPGAFSRTITVNSFSKSWAISGWRIGFAYGPGELVGKLAPHGNVMYVCTPTPLQEALSRVLMSHLGHYDRLRENFARKRQILIPALESTGFAPYDSGSSFYIWSRIPGTFASAVELNEVLMKEAKMAGVPGSAFFGNADNDSYMRFCVAREDTMLQEAADRLVTALG